MPSASRRQSAPLPLRFLVPLLGLGLLAVEARAGAWTVPSSRLWAKISYLQQTTHEWYIDVPEPRTVQTPDGGIRFDQHPAGTRRPYRFDGEYDSKAVFLEGFFGVTDWLNVGVQVPYFDQVFDDDTQQDPPSDAGFSDIRVFTKWRLLQAPAVVSLKAGAKMPTGKFRNLDGLIPVGEGQWDFDVLLQVGRSLWPVPAYANVDVGYRVRLENEDILRDPGDEWLFNAETGYAPRPHWLLSLKLEMLRGKAGRVFGFRNDSLKKHVTYVAPAVSYTLFGTTAAELALRYTVAGRNFPAGYQLALGVSSEIGR